jgi:DNA repair ATPase RecN
MANGAGEQVVKFTAKELFLEINRKLDGVSDQLSSKADKEDLEKMESQLSDLQRKGGDAAQEALRVAGDAQERLQKIERDAASNSAVKRNEDDIEHEKKNSRWQWFVITISVMLGIANFCATVYQRSHP